MGKGCKSASHQLFKDKARNRVDDLQEKFTDLQSARKESRAADVAVLEEQVHQMLREWKAELNQASPATSLQGHTPDTSDLFSETLRLLQLREEEDDATSKLAELAFVNAPKPEQVELQQTDGGVVQGDGQPATFFQEEYYVHQEVAGQDYLYAGHYESNLPTGPQDAAVTCLQEANHFDYQQYNLQQEMPHELYVNINSTEQTAPDVFPHMSDVLPTICPPPSAFLRPKCALWDCPRPTQGSEWCQDYCSSFHATLAINEGPPGMTPVLRPGGIDLKDGPLLSALSAKILGKNVGIPVCEGAATTKSPWNAPELFDLCVLEGESLREWLFFDKPRRAFESGNRKQRSLPDYNGRGWHESRKQIMKEFGGLKRSYYMDPQPLTHYEWHMYEYEINDCEAFALYRLEFKLVDPKKGSKAKLTGNSLVDLQQQMGRLKADNIVDPKKNSKSRTKANQKDMPENLYKPSVVIDQKENAPGTMHAPNQMVSLDENTSYGPHLQYAYTTESLNDGYGT
ncbi:transcription factor VOZ1-like [Curcuma longa]|uniref:transcription factor VOZ1-like n=1 Tax=Curcuma longa TaxID=136217 RepID=UPI003D9EE285